MASKKPETVVADEPITTKKSSTDWFKDNSKLVYTVLGVIILGLLGYIGFKKFYQEPKATAANEQIFAAESLFGKMAQSGFNKDSIAILLNGGVLENQPVTGLLKIISNNGGTPAANRAKYMVGASYLQLKDFDKAIKYLSDFNAEGATQIDSKREIMLGHAYAEKKQTKEALSHYKKAATVAGKDDNYASDALLIAATYAVAIGDNNEAKTLFKSLQTKYPLNSAVQSGEVEKYLAKLGTFE